MDILTQPEWRRMALYAAIGAVALFILFRLPKVGPVFRGLFSLGLLGLGAFVFLQQAPFDPTLSKLTAPLRLDRQVVAGGELRIPLSPDGHFWMRVSINGVEKRMLIDSGASITALSEATAREASVKTGDTLLPVLLRTANGMVTAETGTIEQLHAGPIQARNLKVVVAPGQGGVDVLGMNFLSRLRTWRVEDSVLILTPAEDETSAPDGA